MARLDWPRDAAFSALAFVPMTAAALLAIDRQPSQRVQLGTIASITPDQAEAIAASGECWAVMRGAVPIAAYGLTETFPGMQAVAWALLGADIGRAHVAMTRHVRSRIIASPLRRIEAIVRAADIEPAIAANPVLAGDAQALIDVAMARPTPECRWAVALGLRAAAVLRAFGGAAETHLLFERIRR